MPRMAIPLAVPSLLLALIGCDTGPRYDYTVEYPAAELIAEARREIDHERKLRQSIVLIAPKEKAVLDALRADERVATAHFVSLNAYLTSRYFAPIQNELADAYWFTVYFEAAEDLTAEQAQAVLRDALTTGGLTPTAPKIELANEGRAWSSARPFDASVTPLAQPEPLSSSSFEHLIQP